MNPEGLLQDYKVALRAKLAIGWGPRSVSQVSEKGDVSGKTLIKQKKAGKVMLPSDSTAPHPAPVLRQMVLLSAEGPWFLRCPSGANAYEYLRSAALYDPFTMLRVTDDVKVCRDVVYDARPVLSALVSPVGTDALVWSTLQQLAFLADRPDVQLVPPSVVEIVLVWEHFRSPHLLFAFLHAGHWACLEVQAQGDTAIVATCYDGLPGRSMEVAGRLVSLIAGLTGRSVTECKEINLFPQLVEGTCGHVALLRAGLVLAKSLPKLASLLDNLRPVPTGAAHSAGIVGVSLLSKRLLFAPC